MVGELYLKFLSDRIGEDIGEASKQCYCKGEQKNGDKITFSGGRNNAMFV